ncbi:MAG: energy transducer TonB [Candidatus Pedobacter colombiensis]|uniref:Energy transducer TonB n=1 Tax=Candidatus Pedobacter colombiensis TaxID=3121371 RepID=A0AAJ5W5W0_9SPHI|nr:energy transducer TonB [Pedobacter sp.]WEK19118.1 MAG: energy transducer TonB [Pedobacter sp.]
MYYKSRLKNSGLLKYGICVLLFAIALTMSSAKIRMDKNNQVKAAVYLGDWEDFYKYAKRAVRYPDAAQKALLQGTSIIKFKVVNGLVEDVGVVAELGGGCDASAMKCISSYTGYKDIKDGDYTLKFTFILSETNTPKLNENIAPLKGYKSLDEVTINGSGGLPQGVIDGSLNGDTRVYDFMSIERKPSFEGGNPAFKYYLKENVKYPKKAERNNVSGGVFLSFIVEVDGSITNVKVERPLGSGTDEEAVRVLRESPKWIPGKQKGKDVRVKYNMVVAFGQFPQSFKE